MKIKTIQNTSTKYEPPRLPTLMTSRTVPGFVVLFTGRSSGMVVDPGLSSFDKGHVQDGWVEYDTESIWKPFDGKILLSND